MNKSEQINELATALSKAQGAGNREQEAELIKNINGVKFKSNKKRPVFEQFIEKIAFGVSDCWYWMGAKNIYGYGIINSLEESKAHRVSWKIFHGGIPEGKSILHKCDVRCCVNPDHLFMGTQDDNMKDCARKGRIKVTPKHGESNPMSRLNTEDVLRIRSMQSSVSQAEISRLFGVSPMTISRLIRRESWKTV